MRCEAVGCDAVYLDLDNDRVTDLFARAAGWHVHLVIVDGVPTIRSAICPIHARNGPRVKEVPEDWNDPLF